MKKKEKKAWNMGWKLGFVAGQVLWVSERNKALCYGFEISGISA